MKINVIVTTYNHEKYITQCLESVLEQKGDFQIEVIVGDDCSTDNTRKIIKEFEERYPKIISVLPMEKNLGITKNLKRCLDACSGEYIAICEGDDYWTDEYKLQKQMTLLETHQDFSMCFSALMIYHEDKDIFELHLGQTLFDKEFLTTEELIDNNYIGNFSCCMYRGEVVRKLPQGIFEFFTVDWMFNICCSQFGDIGYIKTVMSVYRQHEKGTWSGRLPFEKARMLYGYIDEYNRFFNYEYDQGLTSHQKRLIMSFPLEFREFVPDAVIIQALTNQNQAQSNQNQALNDQNQALTNQIEAQTNQIEALINQNQELVVQIQLLTQQNSEIINSRTWKVVQFFGRFRSMFSKKKW